MSNFNKYQFISGLESDINGAIIMNDIKSMDDVREWIDNELDTICIYYANCFDIIKELNFTDWSDCGNVTNVTDAAFFALTDFVDENLDLKQFEELIAEYDEE
jgi:p-aminobenzoyl-glutamate transporter AbgT